jgi:hypothetical protein
MIYQHMLPRGQVYTYDGFGENDNYTAIPTVVNIDKVADTDDGDEDYSMQEEMMKIWPGQNHFVLLAQSSFPQLDRISNNALIYENDIEACTRWIAQMAKFQTKMDMTLQYVSAAQPARAGRKLSMCPDFPAFIDLIEVALEHDMLITVNGERASNQPARFAKQRGIDVRFDANTYEHTLLLDFVTRSNVGRRRGCSVAQTKRGLGISLRIYGWHETDPRIWKAVKRISLPSPVVAYLGPHNFLYPDENLAWLAIQAVNMGKEPFHPYRDPEWCASLTSALDSWSQVLREQLKALDESLLHGDSDSWKCLVPRLGRRGVFGVHGDDDLSRRLRGFHRLRLRPFGLANPEIEGFDRIWELAENASGELYRTEIHLLTLVLWLHNRPVVKSVFLSFGASSRKRKR